MVKTASDLEAVRAYHQRTKHRFEAYAAGPDALDWDDQPEPFRWFDGAPRVELPLLADSVATSFADLYRVRRIAPPRPVFERLAILLERSLGLAAWKSHGATRWALRCNPSSGNLHPTEAYVVAGGSDGLDAGVYHYLSRDHLLERRCRADAASVAALVPEDAFLVGLSSIHWREAWKYGERAFRYCQHDCGHAIAALGYAAAAVGWSVRVLDTWADDDISRVLGLDRVEDFGDAEVEHPDVMLWVGDLRALPPAPDALGDVVAAGEWRGRANRLSPGHYQDWRAIDAVARASRKPRTAALPPITVVRPEPLPPPHAAAGATSLLRRRRSAQAFDGVTGIDVAAFYRMLDMTLPRPGVVPWDSWPWRPRIHLVLFVHRVTGLRPGLYLLARHAHSLDLLRETVTREAFEWEPVPGAPSHLPLYGLVFARCERAAATLSCHQAIAGDSAFSLGMLAEFDAALDEGAWRYRQLFWEAGMLGQVLYLEAEAAAVSGTGIGCYFDDPVHELLGIGDTRLQSLYHFTVGGALTDERLVTAPPYSHLRRSGRRTD